MAGAKETPRQKLIALMYLVFITMLALNVSKEVLDGFGQMFKKIGSANDRVDQSNEIYYNKIKVNAEEKEGKWIGNNKIAVEIKKEADEFYSKIQEIKDKITEKQREVDPDLDDYARMDKGEELNSIFFDANGVSEEGLKFVEMINLYKGHVIQVFASKFPRYTELVEERFFTGDFLADKKDMVETRDGTNLHWLRHNYEDFPLISSLAKLTMMQNDIRLTESDVLNALLGKELEIESKVNTTNYITLLKSDKGAYYQGETFDGSVVLGRKGGAQNPNSVELTIDGRKLKEDEYEKIPGGVKLNISSGRPGDRKIEGNLVFLNEGEESKIPVDQSFAVIAKPNSAVISADKMNVVYRGVENPMTISIPGIADNKIKASAPGLKRVRGSKYVMIPGRGREVSIRAGATLPDGQSISTVTKFRIKSLPPPIGIFAGKKDGKANAPKAAIEKLTVSAGFDEDFDYKLPLRVVGFTLSVPGLPDVIISGNKFNAAAKRNLKSARSGSKIIITDIKVRAVGNSKLQLRKCRDVIVTVI